ncbi:ATP synthase subunit I [Vannielia sp.]|uniref:N-ATPase subunit AtpR n=1 Tax=Vannielia sp. TaxID=2813045 RepID=UPI0026385B1D|nr:ATP synthase subunit I [Vannielia sp.]
MTDLTNLPLFLTLPLCFGGGLLLGFIYFRALRMTADLVVGQGNALLALGPTFGRLALLGGGFYLAVLAGALPLLFALAGVLLAKTIMMRLFRGAQP